MEGSTNRRYSPAPSHKNGSSASPLRHLAAQYWVGYPAPAQGSQQGTSSSSCEGPSTSGKAKKRASDAAPHRLGRLRLGGFVGGMMLGVCLSQWLLSWLRAPQLQLLESGEEGGAGRGLWWGRRVEAGVQASVWGPAVAVVEAQCAALLSGKRQTLHAQARGERDRWDEDCRIEVEFERKRARLHALGSLEALRATARRAAEKCQAELSAIGEAEDGDVRGRLVGRGSGLQGVQLVHSKELVEAFFPGMAPFGYRPHSLLITTPGAPVLTPKEGRVLSLNEVEACGSVEVVMIGSTRCYALTAGGARYPSRWLHKFAYDHDKHPISPPPQNGGAGQGKVATRQRKQEQLEGWHRVTRIPHEGKTPPTRFNAKKHEDRFLSVLLSRLPDVEREGRRLLAPVVDKDTNLVVAMAVTQGDLDTLVNLACSMRKRPSLHPAMSNVMVFAGDEVVVTVARSLGFHAMSHPAFGELPTSHAEHYGDAPFLEVMWLKSMAAWLVNRLGYHVLFQDADVVWFQDPRPMLLKATETGEAWREGMALVDSVYMDDGARSERFGPYFMNSGFFFFRHNHRTTHLLQSLLWVHDMVIQWASHQTSFIQAIELHHVHYGLTFRLLDRDEFPGGRMFHHEKEKLEEIHQGTRLPYIFHMNWCQYKHEKLQFFKEAHMWYVDDDKCSQEQIIPPPPTTTSLLRGPSRISVTTSYCCSTRADHV